MLKTAFLYAGQGSQKTGMGKDFYEKYDSFRAAFDSADLDFDIHEICFDNPDNKLIQTEYTQPCMVAFACGVTEVLKEKGINPDYVCGLSLGEYSALYCAGVMDAKTTIETVAYRGKVMAESSRGIETGMEAVIGLDKYKVKKCCEDVAARTRKIISVCNLNCPGQVVIGGEKSAVDEACRLCKESGAKRCLPLQVSGPFHTAYMKLAGDKLGEYLKSIDMKLMQVPVLFNYIGGEMLPGENIKDLLVKQIQNPVLMEDCIRYLFDNDVQRFVEIGPGTALTGFVKKTAKDIGIADFEAISIENIEDVDLL